MSGTNQGWEVKQKKRKQQVNLILNKTGTSYI